jgi:hypothetical protein
VSKVSARGKSSSSLLSYFISSSGRFLVSRQEGPEEDGVCEIADLASQHQQARLDRQLWGSAWRDLAVADLADLADPLLIFADLVGYRYTLSDARVVSLWLQRLHPTG